MLVHRRGSGGLAIRHLTLCIGGLLSSSSCFDPDPAGPPTSASDAETSTTESESSSTTISGGDSTTTASNASASTTLAGETSASPTSTSESTSSSTTTGSTATSEADTTTSEDDTNDPDASTSSMPSGECGNGVVEGDEDCDDEQATITCSSTCRSCTPPDVASAVDQELSPCTAEQVSDCRDATSNASGQSNLQAFTVTQAGVLDHVELYARNDASSTTQMTVALIDGGSSPMLPSGLTQPELVGMTLATSRSLGSSSAYSWVRFDFSDDAIPLESGHHYFIWLRMLPPLPDDTTLPIRWNTYASPEVVDPYPEGRSFFCPSGGETCESNLPYWDYAFRVAMTPAPPLCGA